jgi:hypothetical protein
VFLLNMIAPSSCVCNAFATHIGSKKLGIIFIKINYLISCLGYLFSLDFLELLLFTCSSENEGSTNYASN